jgi:hypothetical protein
MLNKTFLEVLKHEGPVTIISSNKKGYHLASTWNSYIRVNGDQLIIPAAGMHGIEGDVAENPEFQLTFGSKEVMGTVGPGAGFYVKGTAEFLKEGPVFEQTVKELPFATRALVITVTSVDQKI